MRFLFFIVFICFSLALFGQADSIQGTTGVVIFNTKLAMDNYAPSEGAAIKAVVKENGLEYIYNTDSSAWICNDAYINRTINNSIIANKTQLKGGGGANRTINFRTNQVYFFSFSPDERGDGNNENYLYDLEGAGANQVRIYSKSSTLPSFPANTIFQGVYVVNVLNIIDLTQNSGFVTAKITQAETNTNELGLIEIDATILIGQSNTGSGFLDEVQKDYQYAIQPQQHFITTLCTQERDTIESLHEGYNSSNNCNNQKITPLGGVGATWTNTAIFQKFAEGGVPLDEGDGTDWNPNSLSETFARWKDDFRVTYNAFIKRGIVPKYQNVIWIQGEADSQVEEKALDYENNLNLLIDSVNAYINTISGDTVKQWVMFELQSDSLIFNNAPTGYVYADTVNAAMQRVALQRGYTSLRTNGGRYDYTDHVHYSGNSLVRLGIEASKYLIPPNPARILISSSLVVPESQVIRLGKNSLLTAVDETQGLTIEENGNVLITTNSQATGISLEANTNGLNGPFLSIFHNSETPEADDKTSIAFAFNDDTGTRRNLATFNARLLKTPTSALSENSVEFSINLRGGGATAFKTFSANVEQFTHFTKVGVIGDDTPIRLERVNGDYYDIQIDNGLSLRRNGITQFNINPAAPENALKIDASGELEILTTSQAKGVVINNDNDGSLGAVLSLYHNSASPATGDRIDLKVLLNDVTTGTSKLYSGLRWDVIDTPNTATTGNYVSFSPVFRGGGSTAFKAWTTTAIQHSFLVPVDMGLKKITNLAAATAASDAVRFDQLIDNTDNQTLSITDDQLSITGGNTITIPTAADNSPSITQSSHGFAAGDPIYHNATWKKANTANYENLPTAFVSEVIDANNFKVANNDIVTKTAHGLTVGQRYFLTESGTFSLEPSQALICEVFTPIDANTLQVNKERKVTSYNLFNDLTTRNNTEWSVNEATTVTIQIKTYNSSGYNIFWGDGSSTAGVSNTVHSHTYGSAFTGEIELKGLDGIQVEEVTIEGRFCFDVLKLWTFAPKLQYFDCDGASLVYGDASKMPVSMQYLDTQQAKIYGDISSRFRSGLLRIRSVTGTKISFDWSKLPTSIDYIGITGGVDGANAYGLIQSVQFTNPTHLDVQGKSSLTGDLGFLGNFPVVLNLSGACNIETYTAKASGGTMNYLDPAAKSFILAGNNVLSTTEIDNILIDLNSETTSWASPGNIIMTVGGAARSAASDTAVTALKSKGATITINGVLQ